MQRVLFPFHKRCTSNRDYDGSLFAWFGITAKAKIATDSSQTGTLYVSETKYSLGDMDIGLLISANDANYDKLLMAHYKSYEKAIDPCLTTGYIDGNGVFQDLGYITESGDDQGKPNLGNYASTSILSSTLTLHVDIDYTFNTDGAYWHETGTGTGVYDYFHDKNGNDYAADEVEDMIAAATIKIGIGTDSAYRIRFFKDKASAAESDSNWYCDATTFSASAKTWVKVDDGKTLSSFTLAAGLDVGTVKYYVWGGETTSTPNDDTSAAAIDGKVSFAPRFYIENVTA